MKTFKTVSTIITAVLLLIATEQVNGQVAQTSTDVTVAAEVVGSLTFSPITTSLNFGLVGQGIGGNGATGTNPSINPVDGKTANILDDTDVSIAKYQLSGTDGLTVDFSYSNLQMTNGSKVLNYVPNISVDLGDATTDNPGNFGGTLLSAQSTADQVLLDGDTDITLWVGGTLEEDDTNIAMETGTYSGDFTITVDYVE